MFACSTLNDASITLFHSANDPQLSPDDVRMNSSSSTHNLIVKTKNTTVQGRDFCFQHSTVRFDIKKTIDYFFEGDMVSLVFVLHGTLAPFIHQTNAHLSPGTMHFICLDHNKIHGQASFLPKRDYEIVLLLFERAFLRRVLTDEPWINHRSIFPLLINATHKIPNSDFLFSFNHQIHDILLHLFEVHKLLHHQIDYIHLKIKELFLLIHILDHQGDAPGNPTLVKVKFFIQQNILRPLCISEIALHIHISESKLKKDFKQQTGQTIHQYILDRKMERAQKMISQNLNVNELANSLGFHSVSHFIKVFKKYYNLTPKEYANRFN